MSRLQWVQFDKSLRIARRAGPYRLLLLLSSVALLLAACTGSPAPGPEASPLPTLLTEQVPSPTTTEEPAPPATEEPTLPATEQSAPTPALEGTPGSPSTSTPVPVPPTPTSTELPAMITPSPTSSSAACALGMGLRRDTVELHQAYPPAGRFVMVSSVGPARDYFPQLEGALRVLVAPSLARLQELAARAEEAGVVYDALGYGLERGKHTTAEEQADPRGATEQAAELAAQYGKLLVLGPGFQLMQDHRSDYAAMAALVDVWILQSQRLQVNPPGPEYRQEVEELVREIRTGNPDIQIWVQISVTPGPTTLSVEEWQAYHDSIIDLVDGVYVFDVRDPNRPETLEAILKAVCGDGQ